MRCGAGREPPHTHLEGSLRRRPDRAVHATLDLEHRLIADGADLRDGLEGCVQPGQGDDDALVGVVGVARDLSGAQRRASELQARS